MAVSTQVVAGLLFAVTEGTSNADTIWMLTTNDPITLNTTTLTFVQKAPSTGTGITSIEGLTAAAQFLDISYSAGPGFSWATSGGDTHVLDVPYASDSSVGIVSTGTQTFYGAKTINRLSTGIPLVVTFSDLNVGNVLQQWRIDEVSTQQVIAEINSHGAFWAYENSFGSPSPTGYNSGYWCELEGVSMVPYGVMQHQSYGGEVCLVIQEYYTAGVNAGASLRMILDPINSTLIVADASTGNTQLAVWQGGSERVGVTGTSGGGDAVHGGLITSLGSGTPITIGNPVSGGTSKYVLFVDGSGNLAQSSDFQWDNTAKTLTLGTSGVLISSLTSTPTLSTNSTIAGPYLKSI
jgi:hypothetical protein